MGLEVYYPRDVRNALLAAEQASNAALMAAACDNENEFARGYESGYRAALATIALAFGLLQPDGHRDGRNWQPAFLPINHLNNDKNGFGQ